MLPCMNKKLFGIDCMGCGIQRSLALILKGEFYDALLMYPAIYTLITFFVIIVMNFVDKKRDYHKPIMILGFVNAIIILTSYLYKIFNF